jgi:hypothetical protein
MVNKSDVSKGEKDIVTVRSEDKPFLLYREERCILELSYYVLPLVFLSAHLIQIYILRDTILDFSCTPVQT